MAAACTQPHTVLALSAAPPLNAPGATAVRPRPARQTALPGPLPGPFLAGSRHDRPGSGRGGATGPAPLPLRLLDDVSISRHLRTAARMAEQALAAAGQLPLPDSRVAVVKPLARPPRNHTVRLAHPGVNLKEVLFAEQVQVRPKGQGCRPSIHPHMSFFRSCLMQMACVRPADACSCLCIIEPEQVQ